MPSQPFRAWPDVRVPVTREMITRIVAFLPRFDRPGFLADDDDDALTPDAYAFMQHLYSDGWILPVGPQFDWQWWHASAERVVRRGQIETADAETLRRLLTFVSRLDRTNEGAFANAFDQGWVVRILQRLSALEAETPTEAEFGVQAERLDRSVAESAHAVAATLMRRAGKPYVLELDLEASFLEALGNRLTAAEARPREPHDVTTWSGRLGRIDLVVRHTSGIVLAAVELKVHTVDQVLWDVYKLTAIGGRGTNAYTAVVASTQVWAAGGACTELFGSEPARHRTLDLFRRNAAAWVRLLDGGTARPRLVPAEIHVQPVALVPMAREPELELRVASVQAVPESGVVDFDGDWPARLPNANVPASAEDR
jgi:hypothetical protein